MAKFMMIYHGGTFPQTEEAGMKMMSDWQKWEENMGDKLVDSGNGVGMSKTVLSDGSVEDNGGSNPCSGYCAVSADSIDDALAIAKAHPFLAMDGSIEIAEAMVHD